METNNTHKEKKHGHGAGFAYWFSGTLILFGVYLLGKALGYVPDAFDVFPALLLIGLGVASVIMLFKRHWFSGILCLTITGGAFLSCMGGLPVATLHAYWAGVVILAGILFLLKMHFQRKHFPRGFMDFRGGKTYHNSIDGGFIDIDIAFSGVRQAVVETELKGGEIHGCCAGVELDLRRAILPEGKTFIEVNLQAAGIELHVPSNWNVQCNELVPFAGGYEDTRLKNIAPDDNRVLVLCGKLNFSGISIMS